MSYSLCCWQKNNQQTNQPSHSTNKTSIYTHHLLELLKTSTTEPHLHHGKPTVVTDSISPAINTFQLLAQHRGFHPLLIQLCCHHFFPSCPAPYLAPRTSASLSLSLPQAATHTRSNKPLMTAVLRPSAGEYRFPNRDYLKAAKPGTPLCQTFSSPWISKLP